VKAAVACHRPNQRVAIVRALVNRPSILLAAHGQFRTHEEDIAQFAKCVLVFRDGKIRKDHPVVGRPRASEVLKVLPTLEH
jgi:ABC-type lipoprotein export system ATPase subunit